MSYKRNISIKTELDYTLLIAEIMIHKINIGLVCVGNYFIPNKRCENCYNDYLKFSFGAVAQWQSASFTPKRSEV